MDEFWGKVLSAIAGSIAGAIFTLFVQGVRLRKQSEEGEKKEAKKKLGTMNRNAFKFPEHLEEPVALYGSLASTRIDLQQSDYESLGLPDVVELFDELISALNYIEVYAKHRFTDCCIKI